jgi:GGDEF domain-containing protein
MDANPATQLHLLDVTVTAQRALLRARTPDQLVAALERAVYRLGGTVAPAHTGGADALHLDVGLGVRPPLVPCAAPDDPARERLERVMPGLVEDATQAVHRLWRLADGGDPTLLDDLTGALQPAATSRLVSRATTGTALVGMAVDGDGAVAATHGPAHRDVLLRELAVCLRGELDVDERLGRLHGPGVVAVLPQADPDRAAEILARAAARWRRREGAQSVTLDQAIATIEREPLTALRTLRDDLGLAQDDGDLSDALDGRRP